MGLENINNDIIGGITSFNWINAISWFFFALVIFGGGFYVFIMWKNKKLYNKVIKINEINGDYWQETFTDTAKNVKLGKGGFIILHLKKLKTWKIAYGGRTGKNIYEFYILPDGYWMNSMRSAGVKYIDKNGGLIPIVTVNPLMRGQYTSLEKQIDSLTGEKKGFWENYGAWVMSVGFILIAGVMLWLIAKEVGSITSAIGGLLDRVGELISKLNLLTTNSQTQGIDNGLIPAISGLLITKK